MAPTTLSEFYKFHTDGDFTVEIATAIAEAMSEKVKV